MGRAQSAIIGLPSVLSHIDRDKMDTLRMTVFDTVIPKMNVQKSLLVYCTVWLCTKWRSHLVHNQTKLHLVIEILIRTV